MDYLILNFTDYTTRTTPVNTLQSAFERRVGSKGGNFTLYNMCDLLAPLRLEINRNRRLPFGPQPHEVFGLLDPGTIKRLWGELAIRRSNDYVRLIRDCTSADKIIFAAHGAKDDTDNVYCPVLLRSMQEDDFKYWFLKTFCRK